MTAFTHPRTVAAQRPSKPAIIMAGEDKQLSYAELVDRADRLAALFISLGLAPDDAIAVLMENRLEYCEVCWAAKNAGLHYACISTHLNAEDSRYILQNSSARVLIASAGALEKCGLSVQSLPDLTVLVLDGPIDGALDYEDRLRAMPAMRPERQRGASMLYSSGTTGRPKGVRATLADVAPEEPPARHAMLVEKLRFNADMVFLNPGPFYHAGPLRMMMATQRAGGTVIGFAKFDPENTLDAIEHYRATHGFFVPTMFIRMLRLPETVKQNVRLDTMTVAIHGAAPCPPAIKEDMITWWGPIIYEVYGGTESVGQTSISATEWLAHKGSVGKPGKGCSIKIIDKDGRTLGPNQPGLIYMKSGRAFQYHNDAQKTASVSLSDGYATLGDIGYLDTDGYLYITDRETNMIISGGVNIYPQEAENILATHPLIDDVAVIGAPDPEFGEQVKAIVVLKDDVEPDEARAAEILSYCRARLSHIKCPRSVDFTNALPRNETGKILKPVLRRLYGKDDASARPRS